MNVLDADMRKQATSTQTLLKQEVPTQEAAGLWFTGSRCSRGEFPHPGRSKIPPSCDLSLEDAARPECVITRYIPQFSQSGKLT